jgi:hypothetical protein
LTEGTCLRNFRSDQIILLCSNDEEGSVSAAESLRTEPVGEKGAKERCGREVVGLGKYLDLRRYRREDGIRVTQLFLIGPEQFPQNCVCQIVALGTLYPVQCIHLVPNLYFRKTVGKDLSMLQPQHEIFPCLEYRQPTVTLMQLVSGFGRPFIRVAELIY